MFSGTISPARLRTFSLPDLLGRAAETAVGLELDLPGAAELVEVVDVERAHVDLQGVEDVADAHAHRLGLDAVDVGVELRRVRAEQGEQAGQARLAVGPFDQRVGGLLQRLQAEVAAVFDHELEAAGGAQAVDRRGAEHADHRLGDLLVAEPPQLARRWPCRAAPARGARRTA